MTIKRKRTLYAVGGAVLFVAFYVALKRSQSKQQPAAGFPPSASTAADMTGAGGTATGDTTGTTGGTTGGGNGSGGGGGTTDGGGDSGGGNIAPVVLTHIGLVPLPNPRPSGTSTTPTAPVADPYWHSTPAITTSSGTIVGHGPVVG